jgi:hypothetical protein
MKISFFNEISVSVNKTDMSNNNDVEDRFGLGVGLNGVMKKKQKLNLIFGLEYNLNRYFVNREYEGHYAHSANINYTIHNLSFPFNFRLNFGKNVKIITDLGFFCDLILFSKKKGHFILIYLMKCIK